MEQVEAISLYGLGPDAHIATCQCGWQGMSKTKDGLRDKLAIHFMESPRCYNLSIASTGKL